MLYGFWVANAVAFNGDVVRDLAAQFLALAEKQRAAIPLMVGHRTTEGFDTRDLKEAKALLGELA